MKVFGLLTALTLLAACNGNGGGKSKKGTFLDPITADKFEQEILSRKAGMVTLDRSTGSFYYLNYNSETGKFEAKKDDYNNITRETILKVDGNDLYTLVEESDGKTGEVFTRKVLQDSISLLVSEVNEELPREMNISVKGNTLTARFTGDSESNYEENGQEAVIIGKMSMNLTINLDNIRCSQKLAGSTSNRLVVNGKSSRLPSTIMANNQSCDTSLTTAQLQALDLSHIELCVENAEGEDNCSAAADLSYLVN